MSWPFPGLKLGLRASKQTFLPTPIKTPQCTDEAGRYSGLHITLTHFLAKKSPTWKVSLNVLFPKEPITTLSFCWFFSHLQVGFFQAGLFLNSNKLHFNYKLTLRLIGNRKEDLNCRHTTKTLQYVEEIQLTSLDSIQSKPYSKEAKCILKAFLIKTLQLFQSKYYIFSCIWYSLVVLPHIERDCILTQFFKSVTLQMLETAFRWIPGSKGLQSCWFIDSSLVYYL